MTRENVARRRDRNVLFARAAAGEPFRNARTVFKVDHIMEEIEPFVALSSFDIFFRQLVILLKDFGQVFFVQCKRAVVGQNHGLNRNLVKPFVVQHKDVARKVDVILCKSAADIVTLVAPDRAEFFGVFQRDVVTSLAVRRDAEFIVNFTSAVDADNYVIHLFVKVFYRVVVQKDAVGRQSKFDIFAQRLRLFLAVRHDFFDVIEIHQRLAAEKVDFQIMAFPGICKQEIERGFADFKRHIVARGVVRAVFCKAVTAP